MLPDTEKYVHHLDGMGLSPEEQVSIIRSIERILTPFVDMAWNINSTQLIQINRPEDIVIDFPERLELPDNYNVESALTLPPSEGEREESE